MRPADREPAPGTTARFVLLIAVMAVSTGYMVTEGWLPQDRSSGHVDEGLGCLLAAGADPGAGHLDNELAMMRYPRALADCTHHYVVPAPWWWSASIVAGVAILAWLLYLFLPAWKGRRGRVVPFEADAELRDLVRIAGLEHAPRFVLDPAASRVGAVVFGRRGRYTVRLSGGLIVRRAAEPELFRAVVLHELAHLRNGDVPVTYATVALWRVFAATVLLPFAVYEAKLLVEGVDSENPFAAGTRPATARDLTLAAFLLVLVILARADVLRVREAYADRTAAGWGADPRAWTPVKAGVVRRLGRLLSPHPHWAERRRWLTDPAPLYGVAALPLFLTGAAAMLVAGLLPDLTGTFHIPGHAVRRAAPAVGTALMTLIAGRAVWRAAWYAGRHGTATPRRQGAIAGFWLGVGMVAGESMLSRTAGTHLLPRHPLALLIVLAIGLVTLAWTAECAALWLRSGGRRFSDNLVIWLGLALMATVLAAWLAWWQAPGLLLATGNMVTHGQLRTLIDRIAPPPAATGPYRWPAVLDAMQGLYWFADRWSLTAASAALWSWSLFARLRGADRPRTRVVAVVAVSGALLTLVLTAAARAQLHTWMPPMAQRFGQYFYVYLGLMTLTAVAGTALTGLSALRWTLPTVLAGAGFSALLGVAGQFVLASLDGCLGPLNVTSTTCVGWRPLWSVREIPHFVAYFAVTLGIAGAGLLGAVVRLLAGAWRPGREDPAASGAREGGDGRRPWLRLTGIALALAAVAAGTALAVPAPAGKGAAAQAVTVPLAAPEPPSSPKIHAWQLIAWLRYGGGSMTNRLLRDFQTYDQVFSEAHGGGITDGSLKAACAAVQADTYPPDRYFPVPDIALQRTWASVLAQVRGSAGDCAAALDAHDMTRLLMATRSMLTEQQTLMAMLKRLEQSIKPYGTGPSSPPRRLH
ncbi:M48 family metalloprotease [Actinoallomurus soli]|uniref:M48 family metalloprotease n=1 Tax=Actinoallomurus soli TaxID=2952535 RepID=UPI0020920FCF|nr:M48 family metalloprotease [Actinoallomurus soli]MCO5974299.1 M48 family metalloprotease [Actinoallomurus soli]